MKPQFLSFKNCLILLIYLVGCTASVDNEQVPELELAVGPPTGSGTYDDLLTLFDEFLDFRKPSEINGIPDYSDEVIEQKKILMQEYKSKLQNMNVANWTRTQQVDYLVVKSQFEQYAFDLEIFRPWARDPGFYTSKVFRITFTDLPVTGDELQNSKNSWNFS